WLCFTSLRLPKRASASSKKRTARLFLAAWKTPLRFFWVSPMYLETTVPKSTRYKSFPRSRASVWAATSAPIRSLPVSRTRRLFPFASFIYDECVLGSRELAGQSEAKVAARYFAVACFFLASARRSVFFRRFARFLALSLPLLCPISFKTHLLAPSRHVVV